MEGFWTQSSWVLSIWQVSFFWIPATFQAFDSPVAESAESRTQDGCFGSGKRFGVTLTAVEDTSETHLQPLTHGRSGMNGKTTRIYQPLPDMNCFVFSGELVSQIGQEPCLIATCSICYCKSIMMS